jgi:hypothetical protein
MGYDLVWKHQDQEALRREIGIFCVGNPAFKDREQFFLDRFEDDLQLHPFEWPGSNRPPSEHDWIFGPFRVRYRLHPDSQLIEILSIAATRPTFLSP